jgi:hypothetical protein
MKERNLESLRKDREERPWLYVPEELPPDLRVVFARIDSEYVPES